MEEDTKTAVEAAAGDARPFSEVERLRVRRGDDPLEHPTQVFHPSAGKAAGAGGHGPQLLQQPPLRIRRPLPPRRVPDARALAVHQPLGRVEERAAGRGIGRPLALVLEHDPARRGDVRAAEASRQVEDEEVLVVVVHWLVCGGGSVLLQEEADAAVTGGGHEERATDDGRFCGRRRRAREERGGEDAPADVVPPRKPRDMAAVICHLLAGGLASAAVFNWHYCRWHGSRSARARRPRSGDGAKSS